MMMLLLQLIYLKLLNIIINNILTLQQQSICQGKEEHQQTYCHSLISLLLAPALVVGYGMNKLSPIIKYNNIYLLSIL